MPGHDTSAKVTHQVLGVGSGVGSTAQAIPSHCSARARTTVLLREVAV